MNNEDNQQEEGTRIPLDGSYGMQTRVHLTIITKDDIEGEKEETFEMPFLALDLQGVLGSFKLNLIRGFKIVRTGAGFGTL
jgi:hypothetical protein